MDSSDINQTLRELVEPVVRHDAGGISMKEYEEKLKGLRKDNFKLKLRIYILEERFCKGSPPALQEVLKQNVRLQVEVEELKRQLSDKQELLAAAAEAIDVLEKQFSTTAGTSVNSSGTVDNVSSHDQTAERMMDADDTWAESESAGDCMAGTVNNDDSNDELMKLRKENRIALQMIKGCKKKIQPQDKAMKKIKLDKELNYAQASDSQLEKYQEILKCKDEKIQYLENKVQDVQKNMAGAKKEASGNLQQLLAQRLQGLTHFLDKLLSQKCVLGEDKIKLAESILEQSLALPVGLELDETMATDDFTMVESNIDESQSSNVDDLTMMFEVMKLTKNSPQADIISKSESWSEPEMNVSLGSRQRVGSRSEDKNRDADIYEEVIQLKKLCEHLEAERNDLSSKLEYRVKEIEELSTENYKLKSSEAAIYEKVTQLNTRVEELDHAVKVVEELSTENTNLETSLELEKSNTEILKATITDLEMCIREGKQKLEEAIKVANTSRTERQELEATFVEKERALRRAADEATALASQATLERTRAENDRLKIERELEEARAKLCSALEANSQLEIEATRRTAEAADNRVLLEGLPSEEERLISPDLGIDNDRPSSLEQNADNIMVLSPRSLFEENVKLKQKLERAKATLAETLVEANATNKNQRKVQRAIRREIKKTKEVLRKVCDQQGSNSGS